MTVLRKPPVQGEGERNTVLDRTVTINTPAIDEEATDDEEFSKGFDGQDGGLTTLRWSQRDRKAPDYFVHQELTLINMIHFRVGMHWFDLLIDECLIVLKYELITNDLIKILVVFEINLSNNAILSEKLNIKSFFNKRLLFFQNLK